MYDERTGWAVRLLDAACDMFPNDDVTVTRRRNHMFVQITRFDMAGIQHYQVQRAISYEVLYIYPHYSALASELLSMKIDLERAINLAESEAVHE